MINEENFIPGVNRRHCFITGIFDDDPFELPSLHGLGLEPNHVNMIGIKPLRSPLSEI